MENELIQANSAVEKITFSAENISLIKSQICPKATDSELKLFLYQCQRTGLDPLTRQIYAIHRKQGQVEKMTIQTSIDGFRVIAERSGVYAGQDKPLFGDMMEITYTSTEWQNGQRKDISKTRLVPEFAEVTVFKFHNNIRYAAATGIAFWDEYYPGATQGAMWHKMPHTMLSKCAESVALRKAFPQDLSGLYTADEMAAATEDITHEEVSEVNNPAPTAEQEKLFTTTTTAKDEKPWLDQNSKKYDLVVERLKNKSTTLSQVAQFFKLNKQVRAELEAIVSGGIPQTGEGAIDTATRNNILAMWRNEVNSIHSVAALNAYYRDNKDSIKDHEDIIEIFEQRNKEIEESEKKN